MRREIVEDNLSRENFNRFFVRLSSCLSELANCQSFQGEGSEMESVAQIIGSEKYKSGRFFKTGTKRAPILEEMIRRRKTNGKSSRRILD
jgi:hypothetical protein